VSTEPTAPADAQTQDAAPHLLVALDALPVLGVGVSLSFGVEPDPRRLAQQPGGPSFVEYAGPVQIDTVRAEVEALAAAGVPVLYHPSCLNLCGPWPNPPAWTAAVAAHVEAVGSAWLAQDVAVCFAGEAGGYSVQLGYFVPPVFSEDGLAEAILRVNEAKAGLGRPLLLEPAPLAFWAGALHPLDWLRRLAEATDCGLLLDAGHLVSVAMAAPRGQAEPIGAALDRLDLDRVIELHIAGGAIERRGDRLLYVDQHELPILPEVWAAAREVLRRAPRLRAVCVECEGAAASLALPALEKARQEVSLHAIHDALRAKARAELQAAAPASQARPRRDDKREDKRRDQREASAPGSGRAAVAPAALIHPGDPHPLLLRLLLDPAARAAFIAEPTAALQALGATAKAQADLAQIDVQGLILDADLRARYLMSALCRPYPLSAAALALRCGPAALMAGLADPALRTERRPLRFGEALMALLQGPPADPADQDPATSLDQPCVLELIAAILSLEAGTAEGAHALREAHLHRPPAPEPPPHPGQVPDRARPTLPPNLRAFVLPQPPGLVKAALDGVSAADAWGAIQARQHSAARLVSVARAAQNPVTVLIRAVPGRWLPAPVPGLPPLFEVSHRTAELRGNQARFFSQLDGQTRMADLPPRSRGMVEVLLRAGLLSLAG
jgi:uncharacterized protein (UPF0276 family)